MWIFASIRPNARAAGHVRAAIHNLRATVERYPGAERLRGWREPEMVEWLILTATHILKTVLLGGLALVSWGVDVVTTPWVEVASARVDAVVCCQGEDESLAGWAVRVEAKAAKGTWVRLGDRVPPIRIEALYRPDVLQPVIVAVPKPEPNPAT